MVILSQLLIQFTTRLWWLLSQHGPLPHSTSTFHFQEDLCGASISDFAVRPEVACETIRVSKKQKNAICSSPWSHSLTLSSLHDVIGSMLGVLLQSLLQFPAVLADFYLSALLLLEEENVDLDLESDDDELHSFPQVQVRVPPWCQPIVRNCQARPGAETPPSYNPHPLLTWRNSLCEWEKGAAS